MNNFFNSYIDYRNKVQYNDVLNRQVGPFDRPIWSEELCASVPELKATQLLPGQKA